MEEFEHSCHSWNRKWRIELSSMFGIGNGEVRAKFEVWNRKLKSSSKVSTFEIGN